MILRNYFFAFVLILVATGLQAQNFQTQLIKFSSTGLNSDSGADLIDFNGDGLYDVLCGFESRNNLMLLENLGNTFSIETVADTSVGYYYFKTVDFNSDGYDDILVSEKSVYSGQWDLYMYMNDGNYQYTPHFVFSTGYDEVELIEIKDMDNDGDLDFIIDIYAYANFFYYVKNEGNFQYSWSYVDFVGQPAELYGVADLNSDGLPDVVGAYYNFSVNDFIVVACENDTSLQSGFVIHEIDTVDETWDGVLADFLGDSLPDLLLAQQPLETQIPVWMNTGNFNFVLNNYITVPTYTRLFMPDDYDGDGDMDALTYDLNGVNILRNIGFGMFTVDNLVSGWISEPVAWKDVNGDGLHDLLTQGGGNINIHIQLSDGTYQKFWANSDGGDDQLVVIDADQNGKKDILTSLGSELHLIRQSFDEKYLPTEIYTPSGMAVNWDEWRDALPYDFNNDGAMDMLVGHQNSLYRLMNTNGTFTAIQVSTSAAYPHMFRMTDFDADGNPDFLVKDNNYYRLEWNGSSFTESQIATNSRQNGVMDVDLDGDKDLLYVKWNITQQIPELHFMEYQNNSFTQQYIMPLDTLFTNSITNNDSQLGVSDLDNDGDQDVILVNYDQGKVVCLRNDSGLVFTPIVVTENLFQPRNMRFADMNLDGNMDFVISTYGYGRVYFYENTGNITFTEHLISEEAAFPVDMELADIDDDGDPDILTTSAGDRKIIVFDNLAINCPAVYQSVQENICSGDSVYFGGNYLSAEGSYFDTLPSSGGCDSIVQLELQVYDNFTSFTEFICPGAVLNFNGQNLSAEGTYYDTLPGSNGCDSIIELNLVFYTVPELTFQNEMNILTATAGYATYTWYIDGIEIEGENSASIDAALYGPGRYSVAGVTEDGCIAISLTLFVTIIGIESIDTPQALIKVFPNPNNGQFAVKLPDSIADLQSIKLFSVQGIHVHDFHVGTNSNSSLIQLNGKGLGSGVYFLLIETKTERYWKKVLLVEGN